MKERLEGFYKELNALIGKYRLYPSGTLRLIDGDLPEWDTSTATLGIAMERRLYGGTDRCGPFLAADIQPTPPAPISIKPNRSIHINPDIAGYDCPVTGKWIDGRKDHRENLKRHNCRLLEPGEKREAMNDRERNREAAIDKAAREAVSAVARHYEM